MDNINKNNILNFINVYVDLILCQINISRVIEKLKKPEV